MRFDTIACCVDFSEPSRVALDVAAELARGHEARLTLVHVCEPPPVASTDVGVLSPELMQASVHEAERTLAGWRTEAQRLAGKPVLSEVLTGYVADQIIHWARDHRADVIVVGTHGRKGFSRLVLGSVAERVVQRAPCPVVVARKKAHDSEGA